MEQPEIELNLQHIVYHVIKGAGACIGCNRPMSGGSKTLPTHIHKRIVNAIPIPTYIIGQMVKLKLFRSTGELTFKLFEVWTF